MHHGLWTYAVDLVDEGMRPALARIAAAGFRTVNLHTNYHAGKLLLPHNLKRRVHFSEDGAVFFTPRADYGTLTPRVHSLVGSHAPLDAAAAAMPALGLELTAWTICLHNSWLGSRFPDCCMQTAFGDPLIHSLSPAHPAVRQYMTALLTDILTDRPVTDIQLESPGYMGFRHGYHHELIGLELSPDDEELLAISFNDAELLAAAQAGVDATRARQVVASALDASWNGRPPADALADADVIAYRAVLEREERALLRSMRETIRAVSPATRIWHFAALDGTSRDAGLIAEADGILCGYARTDDDARQRAARAAAFGKPIRGQIRAIAPDHTDPATIAPRLRAWAESGVEGVDVYNYGLMSLPMVRAVADAIAAVG